MRHGIISDIHGNVEAFRAVVDELSKESVDDYISLGDVVGYGADPKACIETLKLLKPRISITGNHEWGVAGLLDLAYFSDDAKEAIIWTKGVLSGPEIDFLKSFGLAHNEAGYSLVHGSLDNPAEFNYIVNVDDARRTMTVMGSSLCFVGHSHYAGIFYSDKGRIMYADGRRIKLSQGEKYIVNAGSVGQPRDGDPRASFVIYDDAEGVVEIKRVKYDTKRAADKILAAGLPAALALRLSKGI